MGLILFLIFAAVLAFEIIMLVDAIKNPRITTDRRVLWIVGMLLIHPIVAIVYYFTDYKKA